MKKNRVLLLLICSVLCSILMSGCGLEEEKSQTTNTSIEDIQADNIQQSKVSEEQPEVRFLQTGIFAPFASGDLVYTIPKYENEDYKLYFFATDYSYEIVYNLEEADYVFPDVREKNASIGKFIEIYFIDTGRLLPLRGNDETVLLAIATYEKDGNQYFDMRVYEFNENEIGVSVNYDLTQKLNEKYYDVEDIPIVDIITLPQDDYIYEIQPTDAPAP